METLKSFVVIVLVLAFACEVERCNCESKYQLPFSKWQVMIWNSYKNPPLEAHCMSKDNDLGVHVINAGTQYSWEFKENFFQTTLFWCNFNSTLGHASFEVFWPEKGSWLTDRCGDGTCLWIADKRGFSLFGLQRKLEFLHPWEPNSS